MNFSQLITLLDELIDECISLGVTGNINIYGGTAMLFHYHELRSTTDVDSMFAPQKEISAAAHKVAERHPGLPPQWFNMQIHDVMPLHNDDHPITYFNESGLIVRVASQQYLLAMKAMSDRRSEKDLFDAAVLFNSLSLRSWMDIDRIVHRYYSGESAGSQELFFEDIEDRAQELRDS